MKHITHAVLLGMLAAALLLLVQTSAIPQGVMLLISGVLFGLSCAIALAAVFFMPELPRLTREKGRTPPHFEMWAFLIFYLADGILLFMDAYGYLEQGLPVRFAAASAALSFLAACMAVASERMRICWNGEGFRLRTAWGNIHDFRWEQLTGHHSYRGAVYLHIGRKRFTVNMNQKLLKEFFRASNR